ncbi:MAG: type II toxin-antitoxin system PemK/MazF family toxin [Actinomycetota bacterium]
MRRGEIWLAEVGGKLRPVVVLTRDEVLDVRRNVTVAEITTQARGLAVEVVVGAERGIDEASVVNADGLHTVAQRRLIRRIGDVDDHVLSAICQAVSAALGCHAGA